MVLIYPTFFQFTFRTVKFNEGCSFLCLPKETNQRNAQLPLRLFLLVRVPTAGNKTIPYFAQLHEQNHIDKIFICESIGLLSSYQYVKSNVNFNFDYRVIAKTVLCPLPFALELNLEQYLCQNNPKSHSRRT